MFGFRFDSTILILIPALIISAIAQIKISSTYKKFAAVNNQRGITGEQTALNILKQNGIYDVDVELTSGHLTDHYDPTRKKLRLSRDIFYGTSIAAVGIAAHEVGHAIQHNKSYSALTLRNKIFPLANLGSNLSWILFLMGLLLSFKPLLIIGIALFSLAVIFQLVTLPVEFDASNRAIKAITNMEILNGEETKGAKSVLSAAALTYIAGTLMALAQLARLILLARRSDD